MQFEYILNIANELQNNCTPARNDEYIAIALYIYSNLNVTSVNPFMYLPYERNIRVRGHEYVFIEN